MNKSAATIPYIIVKDQLIQNTTVILDGHHFKNVTFKDCVLKWNDKGPYKMTNCRKEGNYDFETESSVIANVIDGLKPLWLLEQWFHDSWRRK